MKQYQNLIRTILEEGSWTEGRNGSTLSVFGETMTFYMADGFPIPTTKQTYWKTAIKEMTGFLKGYESAAQFRADGVKIWDKNANEEPGWLSNPFRKGEDDLGPVYGAQWRSWHDVQLLSHSPGGTLGDVRRYTDQGYKRIGVTGTGVGVYARVIDQVKDCLQQLLKTPSSRRILFHGWNPAYLDKVALPACHLLYQFGADVARNRLSLNVYIRSNDVGLGAPFNIVEAAFLLHLFARLSGFEPYKLTYIIGDAHLYENQIEMAKEILKRDPLPLPKLTLSDRIPNLKAQLEERGKESFDDSDWLIALANISIDDVQLEPYVFHEAIHVDMKA